MDTTSTVPQKEMPRYQSHKKVWALQIEKVDDFGAFKRLVFTDHDYEPLMLTKGGAEGKPEPDAGWYYVQYEDGYWSFSPASAFEKGYTRI